MHSTGIVSTLAEQMLQARGRALEARAEGKDARSIDAIDRSIRQTLACIVQLRDPREVAMKGFSLVVGVEPAQPGEVLVRHEECSLPVSNAYLHNLMDEAGVVLRPGQVILLDAVLVKMLVEEALGAVSREEALIRTLKSLLIRASLEADTLEKAPWRSANSRSSEAA